MNRSLQDPPVDDVDVRALQHALIEHLKKAGTLKSKVIEASFRAVPRHLFLPGHPLEKVYSDVAIPIKLQGSRAVSSSSQPAIMAIMLEQLELQPGHHVLEVGAGTGYNAAVMAQLVGSQGRVTTVELDEAIANAARGHLATAGFERVEVINGDGMAGYADNAPYDRIILTVGGWDIAPPWLDQLKPNGRIVLPLSVNGPQFSTAFERHGDNLTSLSVAPCGFMRLRGGMAEPHTLLNLGDEPDLFLEFYNREPVIDSETVFKWLAGPSHYWATEVTVTLAETWGQLQLWLSLHEPQSALLVAQGEMAERGLAPYLFRLDGEAKARWTQAVVSDSGLSALTHPPDESAPSAPAWELGPWDQSFELYLRSYGSDRITARRVVEQIQAWDRQGRPGEGGLRIRAYPIEAGYVTNPNEHKVTKRWFEFILDWPAGEAEMSDQLRA